MEGVVDKDEQVEWVNFRTVHMEDQETGWEGSQNL